MTGNEITPKAAILFLLSALRENYRGRADVQLAAQTLFTLITRIDSLEETLTHQQRVITNLKAELTALQLDTSEKKSRKKNATE